MKFAYPSVTTVVPANVGIVAGAPNRAVLRPSSSFCFRPWARRSCWSPRSVACREPGDLRKSASGLPNPFKDANFQKMLHFDVDKSERRTAVVDTLFDQMITFQLADLSRDKADARGRGPDCKEGQCPGASRLNEARTLVRPFP